MSQLQHSFHSYQFKTDYNSEPLTIVATLLTFDICGAPDYAPSTTLNKLPP